MEALIYQMERLDLHIEPPPPKELTRIQLEKFVRILYNENKNLKIYVKYLRENKINIKKKKIPEWVY
jgi:hypothetical protein